MVCEPSCGTRRRDILRPARGRCGLVRDKIRPADTKAPNLGCFALAGRFFSRARDKPAAPGEFCLAVTMHSGRPATVPPTRRPTDVRKTSDSQISHAIPPVQESTPAQKPQNLNDSITGSEIQSGELHATLIVDPEMRVRTPASIRGAWPGLETAHHRTALQAPPVWRTPEGPAAVPVGGGGAWPGFETTRRAKLAARTARGRAAAHRHTQRPGPPAPGTPAGPQATPEIWRGHKHRRTEKPQNSS